MSDRDDHLVSDAGQVVAAVDRRKPLSPSEVHRCDLLSTGSTLLNLACSDNPNGGFLKGKYYFLVGDSASGKTFLAVSCFAEAIRNEYFRDYRLIYDNVEDGCLLDVDRLFGEAVADRIEPPAQDEDGAPVHSFTIEEFYYHLDDAIRGGKPFIYVLDSMDGLSSESEVDKFREHKKAYRSGREAPGSYGDGKAKINSTSIRTVLKGLRETGSILIVISQTRDDIGSRFGGKTRSGGHALTFYATVEIWTSIKNKIKKLVREKERPVGVHLRLEVRKNRITGKTPTIFVDIYPSYGIDDIGSSVDFLVEEGWWKKVGQKIDAKELGIVATREKLIRVVEHRHLERDLRGIVGLCWSDIENACSLSRRGRYETPNDSA